MTKVRRALLFVLCLGMIVAVMLAFWPQNAQAAYAEKSPALTVSGPIIIDSDAELMEMFGTTGDGTIDNPYIINALSIDATGHPSGIFIGNTTKYLVISDCSISNAAYSGPWSQYYFGSGITLFNVQHCTVLNNTLTADKEGITDYGGTANIFSYNNCSGNERGIGLYYTTLCTISYNELYDNFDDIALWYSSSYNVVSHNFVNASDNGIFLMDGSNYNIIDNNSLTNSLLSIHVSHGQYNVVENNTCRNGQVGVYLGYSSYNHVQRNNLSWNECGVHLQESSNNTITKNNCNDTLLYGFYVLASYWNVIQDNTCYRGVNCVYMLDDSHHNTISYNRFGASTTGLYLHRSSNNTIIQNTLEDIGQRGLLSEYSNDSLIQNNNITRCGSYGVYMFYSHGNMILENIFINNNGTTSAYVPFIYQAYDKGGNYWNSSIVGNFWLNWCTPDANGDGIVDSPYSIEGGASDARPIALPTLTITSPSSGTYYTNDIDLPFLGTASGIGLEVTWLNTADGSSGTCSGTTSWNADIGLVKGVNVIAITAEIGNGISVTKIHTLFYDDEAPMMVFDPFSPFYLNHTSFTLGFTATDATPMASGYMAWYVNGVLIGTIDLNGTVVGNVHATWSHDFTLLEGHNLLYFYMADSAGNKATWLHTVTCDVTEPTVSITSPSSGALFNTNSVTVSWSSGPSLSGIAYFYLKLDGGTEVRVSGDAMSHTFTGLSDGSHTVAIKVQSWVSLWNSTSVTFSVHTEAPTIDIISLSDGQYITSSSAPINWTASDSLGISHLSLRVDGGAWENITVGATSLILVNLSEGTHVVELKAIDAANNPSVTSVTFIVDTTWPTAEVSPNGNDVAISSMISIWFSEQMNASSIMITVDGLEGTIIWDGNNLTFEPLNMAFNAMYVVKVDGKDLAGNPITLIWDFATHKVGHIEGLVVDGDDRPVANATVSLGNMTVMTDESGHFVFENITVGNYTLVITKDGFDSKTLNATVEPDLISDLSKIAISSVTGPKPQGTNDSTMLMVGVIAVIGIAAVGGVAFLRFRRK